MYDEFERAVTGKSRSGPSPLGWLFIAVGILFLIGIVGAGATAFYVHRKVEQFAGSLVRQLQQGPAEIGAAVVSGLESHARLLEADPVEGLTFLRNLPQDAPPEKALMELASLDLASLERMARDRTPESRAAGDRGSRGREPSSRGGDVSVSLRGDRDGGYLFIQGRDGHVRFDLVREGDGGSLLIDSNEGQVRFDLKRSADGGELVVETEEGTFRFGAGDGAQAPPAWVPRLGGMPADPRRVYSLASQEGFLGAVAWETEGSPRDLLASYRGWLEAEGYELQVEHRLRDGDRDHGSLWARNEALGRVVFMVADHDRSRVRILLGYGEGR